MIEVESIKVDRQLLPRYGLIIRSWGRPMRRLLILALLALSVAGGLAISTLSAQPAQACGTSTGAC
jgi:hypothetical protein